MDLPGPTRLMFLEQECSSVAIVKYEFCKRFESTQYRAPLQPPDSPKTPQNSPDPCSQPVGGQSRVALTLLSLLRRKRSCFTRPFLKHGLAHDGSIHCDLVCLCLADCIYLELLPDRGWSLAVIATPSDRVLAPILPANEMKVLARRCHQYQI